MSVIHTPRKPNLDVRLLAFPAVMFLLLSVLFVRLWYFQVVKAPELIERADASREIKVLKPAPRGLIYDRNGVLVAGVRPEIVVTAIPKVVQKNPWVVPKVAQMLGVDPAKLQAKLRDAAYRKFVPTPIFVGASVSAGTRIAEAGDDLPGIGVESQSMRFYPDTTDLTHVLGYVWIPSTRDVERMEKLGLSPADYVGKLGVEKAYEAQLMGDPGDERIEVDAKRRPVRVVGRDTATPGEQLTLTIDAELQKYATSTMGEKGYRGGVVALDPRNGEILCLVSSPTYDQRIFESGISQADWNALLHNPANPLMNRPIQSAYAPGSTFKIVTSLAAYRSGKFDPHRYIYCDGAFHLGKHQFKCLGHHGSIDYATAMAKSCNTYFCTLGSMIGREGLLKAAEDVGLGARTGIEIGGETRGDLPDDRWLKRYRRPAVWYGGDAVNTAIGQGAVNTSPLQMANVAALVATDGTNFVPHLVRTVRNPAAGRQPVPVNPTVAHHVMASPEFWRTLKDALAGVIEHGTAQSARIDGVAWAGKTGSAEHGHGTKTHSWFVGFAPLDNPRIAICVLAEAGGHGGETAAPIAKAIVQRYLTKIERKRAASEAAASARAASPARR